MSFLDENRLSTESDTQTDLSVTPHVLHIDEVANVFSNVAMQTTITCLPTASVSTILPQLKANLMHKTQNVYEKHKNTQPTADKISLKWSLSEIESILGLNKINFDTIYSQSNLQGLNEANEDTEETDEFEEAVDETVTSENQTEKNVESLIFDESSVKDYSDLFKHVTKNKSEASSLNESDYSDFENSIKSIKTIKLDQHKNSAVEADHLRVNEITQHQEADEEKKNMFSQIKIKQIYFKTNKLAAHQEQNELEQNNLETLQFKQNYAELENPKLNEPEENKTEHDNQESYESKQNDSGLINSNKNQTEPNDLELNDPELNYPEQNTPEPNDLEPNDPEPNDQNSNNPEVNDPESNDSEPNDPEPNDPEPNDPEPDDPEPDNPEPDNPEPDNPEPDNPEPDNPEPDDPEPDDPEPNDPEPNDSKQNDEEQENLEGNKSEQEDLEQNESEQKQDEKEDENKNEKNNDETEPTKDNEGSDEKTALSKTNCSCGSNALKRMAEQFRDQSIKLTREIFPSNVKFDEGVVQALNVIMAVLQTEVARLIDVFSDSEEIASTSCNCIDSPLTARDTVKVTVDEKRNTLHIKINQYTEIDEFHLSRNAPGDHAAHKSNNIECECHPSHSGAAPPYLFVQTEPRGSTVPSYTTSIKRSCCNKISSHQAKTPLTHKHTTSVRGKKSMTQTNDFRCSNKTCYKDKSIGVQTEIALGDRMQSESLNSLNECCSSSDGMAGKNISLSSPGPYNIKSIHKKCVSTKETSVRVFEPSHTQRCRSCGPRTEKPWKDILLPQSNTFKNALSRVSCSCLNSSSTDQDTSGKLSKPSIMIKMKSSQVAQSKSCPNPNITSKITPKLTPSVPDIIYAPKATVSIKILDNKNTVMIKEMCLQPGDNTIMLNLSNIKAEPSKDTSKAEVGPLQKGKAEQKDDLVEGEEKRLIFAPAECVCKDKIKLNTFKPDPVMVAMETCEAEMRPLRLALKELQMKVRSLNIPELKGCMCTVALEEHSKCVTTLGTGRPDRANIPHIEEPSVLNTLGTCGVFKPATFYEPEVSYPFGHLPPPVLTFRKPVDVSAPASYYNNTDDNKKKRHSCTCKKRKNAHKKTKTKSCQAHVNTESPYEKQSKCLYFSTLKMNSPFVYKYDIKPSENRTNKKLQRELSPPIRSVFKVKSKDTIQSQCGSDDYTDHENNNKLKYETVVRNKENRKHNKKKISVIPHFNKHDFDSFGPYHNIFDVQNLRPGQAVKTHPDDFLLPSKELIRTNDFQSPHSLWSSIFSKTICK